MNKDTKRILNSARRLLGLDEASQRFGGDTNIPASPQTKKYIESGKGIILDVPSSLHPTSRFAIYKNPAKGSRQDKVLMATISNPKRGRVKMFSFHGSHVSHQKAMDFAKKHKLVAMKDKDGNPLYAKESVNESVWRTPEERHQNYHELALGLIANIYGKDANRWREVVKDERWVDSFGDYVKAKINRGLDVDKPGTAGYMDQQGRGDWSFVIDTLTGVVKYTHNRKSGKFKNTVDFGKYIRSVKESVNPEYDEELGKMNIGEGKAWDAITKVKDKHQAQKVHGMIVDAMTANLLHKVHDALNSTNQKKFVAAIDKNAAGLKKMVDFAYKQVK